MSAGVVIFLVILLVRWVWPWLWGYLTQIAPAGTGWGHRGRVLGHRGPGARSFKGRAGRREWWLTTLGIIVISAIVGAVPTIGPLLTLPWVIMTLAVNARRLHDLSLSAWLQMIPLGFGLVFSIFFFRLGGPDNPPEPSLAFDTPAGWYTIAGAAWVLIYVVFYTLFGFVPGRRGPNAYGEADSPA